MPVSTGVNVIEIVQLFVGATVEPQLFVWAKSVFGMIEIPLALMFSVASPILIRVTVAGLLVVFTFWLPKETDCGLRLTLGAGCTVCVIAGDVLEKKLPSPLYTVVMLSGPLSGRLGVLNVARSGHGGVPHEAVLSAPVPINDPLL
jgi:hypothetical protein